MILNFLIELVVWSIIALVVYLLLFQWLPVLLGRTRFEADNVVLRTIRLPLFVAIIAYGAVHALRQLALDNAIISFIENAFAVTLIAATVFLIWRIIKEVILRWLVSRAAETESRVDDLVVPLLGTVGPLVFFLVGLVAILQYLGVNIAVLAASIGVAGLIIGLAFQDSLSNLFSGIYLMVDPAFLENDLIRLNGNDVYSVEKVGLRMTRLYDMENHALIFVPNSNLTKDKIANITKPTIDLKMKMDITMPCSTEPARANQLLYEIVTSDRHVLGAPQDKLAVLQRRLQALGYMEGERGSTLAAAITALEQWLTGDAGNGPAQNQLLAVRKEMSDHLSSAQAAMRLLPHQKLSHGDLDRLRAALHASDTGGETEEIDQRRMARIFRAFSVVKSRLSPEEVGPFESALNRLDELDRQENSLEAAIGQAERAREAELDRLLQTLVWTGDWVAEDMLRGGKPREAARVSLWVRNMAALFAEYEVQESVDGLDKELSNLIDWLGELEKGGLTKLERARVRALFGGWGGLHLLEKRRVGELRRRIARWVEWKEKDQLSQGEYNRLVAQWERKLRILSRKLPDTGTGDEETLDSALIATCRWLHSVNFIEQIEDWKLPIITLKSFDGSKLDYQLAFYIDDIKQQHFGRADYVTSGVLSDLYETCVREGIEAPVAKEA